ncbi:MAG: hypothetical protein NWR72_07295 [Bacteroidia bacterium]|nr:hypothetical protein [Bacteroidia bacterium]
MAGAFAEVTLALDSIHAALLLPTEAVVPKLNEQVVYQIRNGKVSEVSVKTGVRLPRLLQIEQGLADGDTIMVSGLLQAKVGQPVLPGKETSIQLLDK